MSPVIGERRLMLTMMMLFLVILPAVPTFAEDLTLRTPPVKIAVLIYTEPLTTLPTGASIS
jgi:hypothetical protein